MPQNALIKVRRDTAANWTAANPTLEAGEAGYETNTGKIKYGDGATAWNSLGYLSAAATSLAYTDITGVPTDTFLGRDTAGTGAAEAMSVATAKTLLGLTGTNSGDQTITLTGDITGSGTGSFATTLATVNANTGTFGGAATVAQISVNGKGLITGVTAVGIEAPWADISGKPAAVTSLSGTNTGDQTSIVGITGTLAEFNAALTGADFATGGGTVTGTSSGTNTGDQTITLTGNVTGSGTGSFAATIANDAVTNAKLANVATATIKGRVTAATGDPEDLTGTQATTLLDTFTSALKGLAPASGGGTTNFLRADGTWAAPPGGGGGSGSITTSGYDMTSARLLGRTTAATGAIEELTAAAAKTFLSIASGDVSGLTYFATGTDAANLTGTVNVARFPALTGGDVTSSAGSGNLTIANDAVSYAKMQNVSATDRLLGRSTAGAGDVEEIACTAAGRALLDDASASDQRTTLGLGTAAVLKIHVGTTAPGSPATGDLWVDTN